VRLEKIAEASWPALVGTWSQRGEPGVAQLEFKSNRRYVVRSPGETTHVSGHYSVEYEGFSPPFDKYLYKLGRERAGFDAPGGYLYITVTWERDGMKGTFGGMKGTFAGVLSAEKMTISGTPYHRVPMATPGPNR
jgi:hypothetical protein